MDGAVLDVKGSDEEDGAAVIGYTRHETTNQQWEGGLVDVTTALAEEAGLGQWPGQQRTMRRRWSRGGGGRPSDVEQRTTELAWTNF